MRASQASYCRRSSSSRWMAAVLFDDPLGIHLPSRLGAKRFESLDRPGVERLRLPDGARGQDDAGRMLQTLHPDPGLVERATHRHGAMIREQQRVVTIEVGS